MEHDDYWLTCKGNAEAACSIAIDASNRVAAECCATARICTVDNVSNGLGAYTADDIRLNDSVIGVTTATGHIVKVDHEPIVLGGPGSWVPAGADFDIRNISVDGVGQLSGLNTFGTTIERLFVSGVQKYNEKRMHLTYDIKSVRRPDRRKRFHLSNH